jgi:hypothetical protein
VTYDFLTRWGPSFEQFAEHHRAFLHELCDRTIAKENAEAQRNGDGARAVGEGSPAVDVGGRDVDFRLKRLADDVLRVVEQDLRSFQPEAAHA